MKQISKIQQLQGQQMLVADKVDFKIIVNSPSYLSLDSQVMIRSWWMFLIRVVLTVDLDLLLSLYYWTGAAQIMSQSSTVGSSWRCSGEPGTEDSWAGSYYLYPVNLDQIRGVVQGLGQGCIWAEDESSKAEANFTMLLLLSPWFPGNRPISPWFSGWNPICVRGLVRESVCSSGM